VRAFARLGVAVGYTVAFVVIDLVFRTRSPASRAAWLDWTSTNLVNLRDHPIGALVTSAFFAEGGLVSWTATALVGLGVVNWALGNWRTAVLVTTAHVIGTLVSEGVLAYRIAAGHAPVTDRHIVDVGPSYVVVCAMLAGAVYGRGAGRLLAGAGFVVLLPSMFSGLTTLDVAPIGHLCSIAIAFLLGWPLWHSSRKAPVVATPAPVDLGEVAVQRGRIPPDFS
jgi:hypothetical protein